MDVEKIIQAFRGKVTVSDENKCFTCHFDNLNILHHLQSCLEDAGVPLDRFCETASDTVGRPFMLEHERLRMKHGGQCICLRNIRAILVNMG